MGQNCKITPNYQLPVGFQSKMQIKRVVGYKQKWVVTEEIQYYSKLLNRVFTIPNNFDTDLASVPRCMQWLLRPDGQYKYEAALHDYLYRTITLEITREEADLVFKEAMSVGIVADWKEWCLYTAVDWFGGSSFRKRVV